MRTSHYVTPRTLRDAHLDPSMDPIERPIEAGSNLAIFAGVLFLLLGVVGLVATVIRSGVMR